MSCEGPCLKHCYNKNILLYLFIGILIGLSISYIIKMYNKN